MQDLLVCWYHGNLSRVGGSAILRVLPKSVQHCTLSWTFSMPPQVHPRTLSSVLTAHPAWPAPDRKATWREMLHWLAPAHLQQLSKERRRLVTVAPNDDANCADSPLWAESSTPPPTVPCRQTLCCQFRSCRYQQSSNARSKSRRYDQVSR